MQPFIERACLLKEDCVSNALRRPFVLKRGMSGVVRGRHDMHLYVTPASVRNHRFLKRPLLLNMPQKHRYAHLPLHNADGFNADAAAADYFDALKFFFHQFYNRIIFGSCLNKFQ